MIRMQTSTRAKKAILPLLLLAAFLWAGLVPLIDLCRDWLRDPNYSHGFLIPLVSAYLMWRKRGELALTPRSSAAAGLVALIASAGLLVLGVAGAEVFTQRIALILMLASVVAWLHGWARVKLLAFPIAFLLLAIPLPYVVYYGLTAPMQRLAAQIAVAGMNDVGIPALRQGNMIHLPSGSLEVAEACSGIRSLYAFLAVGTVAAALMSIPFRGKVIVFLTTIPVAIMGNALRVWGTGVGTYTVGPQVARGTVHEIFGIVAFILMLGLFLLLRKAARFVWASGTFSRSASSALQERTPQTSGTAGRQRKESRD